jgi:predicted GNAT family acetyltransferase
MPLMVCGPADLRPVEAAGIEVRPLTADDSDLVLSQFLVAAKLCFNEPPAATPQEVESTRQNLRANVYRSAYATVDGTMAGVGSLSAANDELVGIGTLPGFRRRGVATAVSSRLLADHFAGGATLAWLSAGDEAAHATYRKIGFHPVGMQLNYIDGGWDGRTRAGMPPA